VVGQVAAPSGTDDASCFALASCHCRAAGEGSRRRRGCRRRMPRWTARVSARLGRGRGRRARAVDRRPGGRSTDVTRSRRRWRRPAQLRLVAVGPHRPRHGDDRDHGDGGDDGERPAAQTRARDCCAWTCCAFSRTASRRPAGVGSFGAIVVGHGTFVAGARGPRCIPVVAIGSGPASRAEQGDLSMLAATWKCPDRPLPREENVRY
jgi:hypothetical protein